MWSAKGSCVPMKYGVVTSGWTARVSVCRQKDLRYENFR